MIDVKELRSELLLAARVNARKCMKCGKCTASCPSYDEMEYHPHQFVSMIENGDIEPLLSSGSLYRCLSCMACVERCPRGVAPGRLVEAVRLYAERKKGGDYLVPDEIPAVLCDEMPQQALVTAFRKYRK